MVCLPVTDCSKHSHEIAPSGVENINHYSRLTIVENIIQIRIFVSGRQISSLHWADRRLQLHYFTKYEVQLCKIQNGLWSGTRQNSNTYACMYTVHHLKLSVFYSLKVSQDFLLYQTTIFIIIPKSEYEKSWPEFGHAHTNKGTHRVTWTQKTTRGLKRLTTQVSQHVLNRLKLMLKPIRSQQSVCKGHSYIF